MRLLGYLMSEGAFVGTGARLIGVSFPCKIVVHGLRPSHRRGARARAYGASIVLVIATFRACPSMVVKPIVLVDACQVFGR